MESIRIIIKNLFYGFFKTIGSYRYYRYKNRNRPIILTYHGVVPKIPQDIPDYEYRNFVTVSQFERQIQFLLKKYRPMKITGFLRTSIPERSFLITFDDGFRNNFKYAMPILRKYGLEGCFFITTKLIGTREFLWTEQVTRLIQKTNWKFLEIELDDSYIFKLDSALKKEQASQTIRKHLKRQPLSSRNKILEQMKDQLNDVDLTLNKEDEERYLFMNWDEVKEMIHSGQVIGSHTHTHAMLSTLSEKESYQELKRSKEVIEEYTHRPCVVLSYPNGEREDYTALQKKQLKSLGYLFAFTQISPFNSYYCDPFELNRINISLKMDNSIFEAKICGFKRN